MPGHHCARRAAAWAAPLLRIIPCLPRRWRITSNEVRRLPPFVKPVSYRPGIAHFDGGTILLLQTLQFHSPLPGGASSLRSVSATSRIA
jgi:hypothetical protein